MLTEQLPQLGEIGSRPAGLVASKHGGMSGDDRIATTESVSQILAVRLASDALKFGDGPGWWELARGLRSLEMNFPIARRARMTRKLVCALKPRCCPKAPARNIPRSIHEGAGDMARDVAATEA